MTTDVEPGLNDLAPGGSPTHEPASLLANSTFMLLARGFTLASGGALVVYAARTFTVGEYGRYAVAVAMLSIFSLLSEMGISGLALREMSPQEARRAQILGVALAAELATSVVAAAVLVPLGVALGYSSAVLLAGSVAAAPLGLVLLRQKLGIVPTFRGAWKRVLPFLHASAPIALAGAFTAIYERVDVVMVSKLDSGAAAAIYSVPLTIVQYTLFVPAIIGTAFFPLFANTLRAEPSSARASFFLVARLFLFASVPIALVMIAGGGDIVTFLFGDRYHASGGVLLLLGWNVVLGFQIYLLWYGLLAAHRERGMAVLMAAGVGRPRARGAGGGDSPARLRVAVGTGPREAAGGGRARDSRRTRAAALLGAACGNCRGAALRRRPARDSLHLTHRMGAAHEACDCAARARGIARPLRLLGVHSRPARDARKD